jgi:Uma2 family endonuclease
MTKVQTPIKFTYEDYKNLPESETKRYELLEGDLVMVPSPSWRHQDISRRLEFRLEAFVEKQQLGVVADAPLDVILGEDVVQPDILFISQQRSTIIHDEAIRGAPDLVIEILSPATAQRDRTYKKTLYARHGVQEFWLVDPETQTVEVLSLRARGYRRAALYSRDETLESPLLPGLTIPLAEVFSGPPKLGTSTSGGA